MSPVSSSSPAPDVAAGVLAAVAAITAEMSNPAVTAQVTTAIQQIALVQSLATAIQDAVSDLRSQTTTQLAAVGGAAAKLIETGDVNAWRGTIDALQVATQHSQQRLEFLIALAQRSLVPAPTPPAP